MGTSGGIGEVERRGSDAPGVIVGRCAAEGAEVRSVGESLTHQFFCDYLQLLVPFAPSLCASPPLVGELALLLDHAH